jgi:hypothetical protein
VRKLRNVGDVNGDGLADLLANSAATIGGSGTAYLLYMSEELSDEIDVEDYLAGGGGVRLEILDGFTHFDWFNVSAAGDVNRDGFADLLLGVEGGGAINTGFTYIVFGGADLPESITIRETPEEPDGIARIVGEGTMEQAGRPGLAGDFNSDGYADTIIGAPGFQSFGVEAGNVFIVFGGAELPPRIELGRLGARGIKIDGRNVLGGAGFFAGPTGDLDGDGPSDVAFVENAIQEGDRIRVYVLYNAFKRVAFSRADSTQDGNVDISDAILVLTHLFVGGAHLECRDAADANDDGRIDISDSSYILSYLFLGGPAPAAPYPDRGGDPTEDALDCLGF